MQQPACRCHINRQVILSRCHLWRNGSGHASTAERAIHKAGNACRGQSVQAQTSCNSVLTTSISVAAVVTRMAHMYTLWRLGRSGLNNCRQQSVCVRVNRLQGYTLILPDIYAPQKQSTQAQQNYKQGVMQDRQDTWFCKFTACQETSQPRTHIGVAYATTQS